MRPLRGGAHTHAPVPSPHPPSPGAATDLAALLTSLGRLRQTPRPAATGALAAALARRLGEAAAPDNGGGEGLGLEGIAACLAALADLQLRPQDTQVGACLGAL